jgi:hypothetical protein
MCTLRGLVGVKIVRFKGREDTGFGKKFEIRLYPDKTVVQMFGYDRILLFTS